MSGNEAIARGAYEGGQLASAYPGTPSNEIREHSVQGWCAQEGAPNEKVAAEAAIGASIAGVRSFCAMKHVGVNAAADPIFTIAYTVTGGFVIVSWRPRSAQLTEWAGTTEIHAKAAKTAHANLSNSVECKDYMKMVFGLSERFDAQFFHVTNPESVIKGNRRTRR